MGTIGTIAVIIGVAAALVVGTAWGAGQNVTGVVTFNAAFNQTVTAGVPVPFGIPETLSFTHRYSAGFGSNQVDTWYVATINLAASTPQTIDLTTLTDPSGAAANFARVREFYVANTATAASDDLTIYRGAANGWAVLPQSTDATPVRYGAAYYLSDPLSTGAGNGNVVSGTSKTVTFDPGSNAMTIYVLIAGGSAV